MASLSRSLKSPTYLAPPRRRPAMPGRTFSNSSERSDRSATSDDGAERTASGGTTPTHAYQNRFFTGATSVPAPVPMTAPGPSTEPAPSARDASSYLGTSSRPISIEVPRPPKVNSAPVYTPPEPLSARGDLPGGYFPLHEDPKGRVHRPHPFHHEAKVPKNPPPADNTAAGINLDQLSAPQPQTTTSTTNMGASNIPVASYFPTGYQDYALPMGKYYPSNYESTHKKSGRSMSGTSASSVDPRSPGIASPTSPSVMSPSDQPTPETRRQLQLQQYKRDMIAQAARAANDVAAQQNRSGITSGPNSAARGFKGLGGVSFGGAAALHKPNSPRLHPLGSPGPVTPMELESSGGSYLDKGINQR